LGSHIGHSEFAHEATITNTKTNNLKGLVEGATEVPTQKREESQHCIAALVATDGTTIDGL
jgi:hypothetical protein